jgi:hypothetical protein
MLFKQPRSSRRVSKAIELTERRSGESDVDCSSFVKTYEIVLENTKATEPSIRFGMFVQLLISILRAMVSSI